MEQPKKPETSIYTFDSKDEEDLDRRFTYHSPKASQPDRYEILRQNARIFAEHIIRMCPPSRETSLALTNLEQAIMWANASIARNE